MLANAVGCRERRTDVRSNRDDVPRIAADVVKSPRKKRPEVTNSGEPASPTPTARPGPTPSLMSHPASTAALHSKTPGSLAKSYNDDESETFDSRKSVVSTSQNRLSGSSQGVSDDSDPTSRLNNATMATSSSSSTGSTPLPAITPSTVVKQKRTLGSTTLRNTKKPEPKEPSASASVSTSSQVPAAVPDAAAPTTTSAEITAGTNADVGAISAISNSAKTSKAPSRFRSSFLNKSLRHAIEEKHSSASDLDAVLNEPSPFHDAADSQRNTDEPIEPSVPVASQETRRARASHTAHSSGPSLDALRTRLESVRRASTTPSTSAFGGNAIASTSERRGSTLSRSAFLDTHFSETSKLSTVMSSWDARNDVHVKTMPEIDADTRPAKHDEQDRTLRRHAIELESDAMQQIAVETAEEMTSDATPASAHESAAKADSQMARDSAFETMPGLALETASKMLPQMQQHPPQRHPADTALEPIPKSQPAAKSELMSSAQTKNESHFQQEDLFDRVNDHRSDAAEVNTIPSSRPELAPADLMADVAAGSTSDRSAFAYNQPPSRSEISGSPTVVREEDRSIQITRSLADHQMTDSSSHASTALLPASPMSSPPRDHTEKTHSQSSVFQRPITSTTNSATSHIPTPKGRSPGRLREELLSPFRSRIADGSPSRSRLPVSPVRLGTSKIPSPSGRKPVQMVDRRGVSPGLQSPASASVMRPASVADTRSVQPGFGSRIKGLFGLSTSSSRPASVLQNSTMTPHHAASVDLELSQPIPGSFQSDVPKPHLSASTSVEPPSHGTGRTTKASTPIKLKPWQSASTSSSTSSGHAMRPNSVQSSTRLASSTTASMNSSGGRISSNRKNSVQSSANASSQARPPQRISSVTRPAYAYDAHGKRRKLSQHPLSESTNQDDRVSSEDALKNKLTTSASKFSLSSSAAQPARPLTKTVRASNASITPRPPPTNASARVRTPAGGNTPSRAPVQPPRSSAISTNNVFQQKPATQPVVGAAELMDAEDLPDVASEYSDSDDEACMRKRKLEPSWTRGRELEDLLLQQSTVDPDEIFGCQVGPVPLDAMLPPRKGDRRRMRHRTSSANWNGPDGLAQWEIDRYNERMGIRSSTATSSMSGS